MITHTHSIWTGRSHPIHTLPLLGRPPVLVFHRHTGRAPRGHGGGRSPGHTVVRLDHGYGCHWKDPGLRPGRIPPGGTGYGGPPKPDHQARREPAPRPSHQPSTGRGNLHQGPARVPVRRRRPPSYCSPLPLVGPQPNTRRTYDTARRSYITCCAMEGIPAFPPSANSLCLDHQPGKRWPHQDRHHQTLPQRPTLLLYQLGHS